MLQSHRLPLPHPWLESALLSVRSWANDNGYDYRFLDDELFSGLTEQERVQCGNQVVVASDLARLRWCQQLLEQGADRVVWCDADTLIVDPAACVLSDAGCAFGRELWLQADREAGARPKLYKKIHNAFMQFSKGDPVLGFYTFAAARLIDRHARESAAPMVAQLAGPKFLSHLHNVVQFEVLETAQVVSPVLAGALLEQDARLLQRYSGSWLQAPAALNLCASEVLRGSLSDDEMQRLINLLLEQGVQAFG